MDKVSPQIQEGKQVNKKTGDSQPLFTELTQKQCTPIQCFANFMKSLIGICILDLPYVANQTGYLWSCVLLIFIGAISIRCTLFVLDIADCMQDQIMYGDMVRIILGKQVARLSNTLLMMNQCFICIAYVIFFGKFFSLSSDLIGWNLTLPEAIGIAFVFMLPVLFVTNVKMFYSTSFLGVFIAFLVVGIISGYETTIITSHSSIQPNQAFDFRYTFFYISVVFTAIEGNFTVLPIRASIEDKQVFRKVVLITLISYIGICLVFPLISIFAFGNQLDQLIIFNLPQKVTWSYAILITYAFAIMLTYPIQIFPVHIIIDQYILKKYQSSNQDMVRFLCKFILMLLIFCTAYFIPSVSGLLGLMGSICGTVLQFVMPVVMKWVYFGNETTPKIVQIEYICILLISFFCFVLGFYSSVMQLINS